ncbi:hypothetical protein CCHL11_07212 [Colletotrichum chlorophyti]|uniref:Uncharacterized protein n=1 Tax=Colletotrichum chlorophyti TaxID=708187 RepID=A0A1Q8RX72_9PEZI|nr:hypothetical protein CCHL11_07212 [Colletotrichum chlorophyti]
MKFSTAAFLALGLMTGNVVSAPAVQVSEVTLPIEARAENFLANDGAPLEARANNKKKAKAAGAQAQGAAKKATAAKAKASKNKATAAKDKAAKDKAAKEKAAKDKAAKDKANNANTGKNTGANNNNNNNANANANAGNGKSQAAFSGLACTDGKGAGSCNANGQCAVNGKTAEIAGQCGVAAAAAAKKNKRYVSDLADIL